MCDLEPNLGELHTLLLPLTLMSLTLLPRAGEIVNTEWQTKLKTPWSSVKKQGHSVTFAKLLESPRWGSTSIGFDASNSVDSLSLCPEVNAVLPGSSWDALCV